MTRDFAASASLGWMAALRSVVALAVALSVAEGVAAGSPFQARAEDRFRIEEVVPGVFVARPHEESLAGANATFIVGEEDVIVVDTHMTPGSATALLEVIRERTSLPVRFVVETHWHPDHTQGAQAYRHAFPDELTIVAHRTAREEMKTLGVVRLERDLERLPAEIETLRRAMGADPSDPVALGDEIRRRERLLEELASIRLVLPGVTFTDAMTLGRRGRLVRVLYFGRGHTAGDAVVHLPGERVAIVGDLVTGGPPFARDGYPQEWIQTLESLEALDVDTVISGHGTIMGPEVFAHRRAFLESALEVVRAGRRDGLSPDEIAALIDIDSFRDGFDPEPAGRPWRGWMRMIVDRALLDGRRKAMR